MSRKKRVGFITSSPLVRTGFSTNAAILLPMLYKSDKYEVFLLNQGFDYNDPQLKRMPWHNEGVITPEILQSELFQRDDNYRRLASYGNLRVEDFVVKNQLDVVFHVEDPWSSLPDFYFKKDWYKYIKNNFVNWITADSLPILPLIKEWAENCPNLWVWSSFAERALKEEDPQKYGHVKTVHGTLNVQNFKPLSKEEKYQLRRRFGIQDDELLIIHLGRNQLRKLFFANIEALAKFKKQYPNKKARLLLYCSWSEPSGWPLERTVQEYGLSPQDVLCVYFCPRCGAWEVKAFEGEYRTCYYCKLPGIPPCREHPNGCGCMTPGVTSNITQQDLAKIYGMCDLASSPFTSGGLEYFNVESLLCGLPLICTPYSCGEDFVKNDFVQSMDGTYTRERDTNFLKFVPNSNSIVKFINKIYDLPIDKRDAIAKKGREWALNTFSPEVIYKQIEEFIDSRDFIDWDEFQSIKSDFDIKVPDAIIDNSITDNVAWLKELYKKILKMDVNENDDGLKTWLQALNNKVPREKIEQDFRQIALQHNQQNKSFDFKTLLDLDRPNKRGLILMKESGGDIFIITSLFEDFHNRYPNHDLYVMCDPKFKEILEGNPYVHKILPYIPMAENEMFCIGSGLPEGEELFHVYFNPGIFTQRHLNYLSHSNSRELK